MLFLKVVSRLTLTWFKVAFQMEHILSSSSSMKTMHRANKDHNFLEKQTDLTKIGNLMLCAPNSMCLEDTEISFAHIALGQQHGGS